MKYLKNPAMLLAAASLAALLAGCATQTTTTTDDGPNQAGWLAFSGRDTNHLGPNDPSTYDTSRSITVQGTLTRAIWGNPRAWLYLQVPGSNGTTQLWQLKGPAAMVLKCQGLQFSQLTPGTSIQISVAPRRDGLPGGEWLSLSAIKLPTLTPGPGNNTMIVNGATLTCDQVLN